MKNIYILLLILSISFSCLATDCKTRNKKEIFDSADKVFIGKVFNVKDTLFYVKVIEMFKGTQSDTLIGVISQDVYIPSKGSVWIFYAKNIKSIFFLAETCGGTKSFRNPIGFHDYYVPEPPPLNGGSETLILMEKLNKLTSINELFHEIQALRSKKNYEKLNGRISEIQALQKPQKNENKINYLLIGIGLLILLNVILLFLLKRKRVKLK